MNCFSWIKLILVLIHDKYWYCNSSYLEVSFSLTISLKFYLSQLKSSSAQIIFMFFIGFSISSYSIGPQATKSIEYTKPYAKPSPKPIKFITSRYIYIILYDPMQIIIHYGSNTLLIKKLSLKKPLLSQS